jgi:hypothetical protein
VKLLQTLRETTIGRALLAYYDDLPRWTLVSLAFALALVPSGLAAARGEIALALGFSFPAAVVMAGLVRLLTITLDGSAPRWAHLWAAGGVYRATLTGWGACVLAGFALLTPLLVVLAVPALMLVMIAVQVMLVSARLPGSVRQAWRNAFVIALRYPIVALGLVGLAVVAAWGIVQSGGALLVALPALWAAIAVYAVDDVVRTEQRRRTP